MIFRSNKIEHHFKLLNKLTKTFTKIQCLIRIEKERFISWIVQKFGRKSQIVCLGSFMVKVMLRFSFYNLGAFLFCFVFIMAIGWDKARKGQEAGEESLEFSYQHSCSRARPENYKSVRWISTEWARLSERALYFSTINW